MLDIIRTRAQSWGVKIIFGIIIIVFVFWGIGNMDGASSSAVATVNGEPITLAAFEREVRMQANMNRDKMSEILADDAKFNAFKDEILVDMIRRHLRKEEAERLGIVVTPHELRRLRDSIPAFHDASGTFNQNTYTEMLKAQGISSDQFLTSLEQELLDEKLMRYISMSTGVTEQEAKNNFAFTLGQRVGDYVLFDIDEYKNKAEASDAEVAEYFEKHKESYRLPVRAAVEYIALTPESLAARYPVEEPEAQEFYDKYKERFAVPESFQARHIFIPAPQDGSKAPDAEGLIAEAKKQIDEVAAKAAAGEDFAELARKYSKDESTAPAGGMLPMLEKGTLGLDALDDAALALEPGQVSEPVRTPLGFHLLMLVEKKPEVQKTFAEVKAEITDLLSREKAGNDIGTIEKEAEDGLTMGVAFADLGKKFMVEPKKTELLPQAGVETTLGLENDSRTVFSDAVTAAAESGKPYTLPVPLTTSDGLVLVRIESAAKSEIPALDSVKDKVTDAIKTDKAWNLAREAANAALPSFTGKETPADYAARVRETSPVVRVFPEVAPLGVVPELAEALFDGALGTWLPEVYTTEKGPAIVRPARQVEFRESDWEQRGPIFYAQYQQHMGTEAIRSYLNSLAARAKTDKRQKQFDMIRPR